jgi:hypothetical protein
MSKLQDQYSELTISLTKSLSKQEKKDYGIFITPKLIIEKLFEGIKEYISEKNIVVENILEPACGSCEIVNYCASHFDDIKKIIGVEFNKTIYESIKDIEFNKNVSLVNKNFMSYDSKEKYDLIVTNPPYFVCKKADIPEKYHQFVHGRPNIFGFFIIHSLYLARVGGILAFIVPKSFMNSAYYAKIRNYIKETCKIVEIIDFEKDNKFIDTEQSTFGIVLEKISTVTSVLNVPTECQYSMKIGDDFVFSNDTLLLKNIFEGASTIEKMGLKVRTGSIVWNEHKEELTNESNHTLLIYNTNLTKKNTIETKNFKNGEKFQYINRAGYMEPTLVVNRGNGNSKYKLNYAIVTDGPYLIENHLNEIYSEKKIKKVDLLHVYSKITESFKNPKTQLFIDTFLGNNGLSKTELETIFPIYL